MATDGNVFKRNAATATGGKQWAKNSYLIDIKRRSFRLHETKHKQPT